MATSIVESRKKTTRKRVLTGEENAANENNENVIEIN